MQITTLVTMKDEHIFNLVKDLPADLFLVLLSPPSKYKFVMRLWIGTRFSP